MKNSISPDQSYPRAYAMGRIPRQHPAIMILKQKEGSLCSPQSSFSLRFYKLQDQTSNLLETVSRLRRDLRILGRKGISIGDTRHTSLLWFTNRTGGISPRFCLFERYGDLGLTEIQATAPMVFLTGLGDIDRDLARGRRTSFQLCFSLGLLSPRLSKYLRSV
jgi:hypothetical protein